MNEVKRVVDNLGTMGGKKSGGGGGVVVASVVGEKIEEGGAGRSLISCRCNDRSGRFNLHVGR